MTNSNTSKAVETNNTEIVETDIIVKEDLVTTLSPTMFENTGEALFSTIQGDDRKTKVKVYNAISNSDNSLSDHLGEVIKITDFVAHPITLQDEITKEDVQAMRVVLLTKDGVGYHSVSGGVVSSMQRIIGLVGQGPWTEEPLAIVPKEVKTRKGFKTLTLHLQG
ncbi:hypothetical protein [Bacillus sp. ISL-57]|uniref:hypothetical protein n=1 Tax=Bacillus sp. ISL-57 TaxID=2819135 RepID=UPI001BE9A8C0|nr:hypothetical protein [Bacillus sp. ISL-57]MBT2718060.1 hypothetical protein [Bacillus sp. ISL-57]